MVVIIIKLSAHRTIIVISRNISAENYTFYNNIYVYTSAQDFLHSLTTKVYYCISLIVTNKQNKIKWYYYYLQIFCLSYYTSSLLI